MGGSPLLRVVIDHDDRLDPSPLEYESSPVQRGNGWRVLFLYGKIGKERSPKGIGVYARIRLSWVLRLILGWDGQFGPSPPGPVQTVYPINGGAP